jgi:3'-phosphoadenosine 5'-phosphosulfate sulfotransferase (PAPS reductase)/FAD synthetase
VTLSPLTGPDLARVIFPPCGEDDAPTDPALVARLTWPQREQRVRWLTVQAHQIADDAVARWLHVVIGQDGVKRSRVRELVATCVLFSGGNDSTTLAHLFRGRATHALHANTRVGVEATRQYVRDTCAAWGLPLIERSAPKPEDHYENLVIERGFPGFASHWLYYARLKERALDECRGPLGVRGSRKRAALWLAGRRRAESDRRSVVGPGGAQVPLSQYDGSVIWTSPLAHWTKLDLNTYRLLHPDVPRNEVSDLLHMSGECLCGAAAKPGELDQLALYFPEAAAYLRDLEGKVRAAGHPEELCRWGHGLTGTEIAKLTGRRLRVKEPGLLCGDCGSPDGGEVLIAR